MSPLRLADRLRGDESGFAMITAVILLGVISTLMTLILTLGTHVDTSSARGRSWVQALHVAEAGVERTIARVQELNGTFTSPMTVNDSTEEGAFAVTVTELPRKRFRVESTGTVSAPAGLGGERKLDVILAPPPSFSYAIFSYTGIETKNNDTITGDIWANQNVFVAQNNLVTGGVTAATGWIKVDNGSIVQGDGWSGGWDPSDNARAIRLNTNARVNGNVRASVTAPPDPVSCGGEDPTRYKVYLDGGAVVGGDATTWGPVTGPGVVQGTISQNVCSAAPPTKSLPTFTYSASNYPAAHRHEFGAPGAPSATAVTDFHFHIAPEKSAMSGTYYVNQTGPVNQTVRLDLTGVTITGDTTIISNVPIFANGLDDNTSDAILTLVSTYQPPTGTSCDVNDDDSECAVHLKNNFDPSGATAVLIYAPYGPVAIKNGQLQYGAIYSQNIQIKNNQSLTYDDRVERMVGFGDVTYKVESWVEVSS